MSVQAEKKMKGVLRKSSFLFPFFISIYPVLHHYSHNQSMVSLESAIMRIVFSLILAGILFVAARVVLRDWDSAAVAAGGIAFVLLSNFTLRMILIDLGVPAGETLRLFWQTGLHITGFAVVAALVCGVRKRKKVLEFLTVGSVILLLLPLWSITSQLLKRDEYRQSVSFLSGEDSTVKLEFEGDRLPDIYYIVLDGYARSDVLWDLYDYDNSKFIGQLKEYGFYVADSSRANYGQTTLSLLSTFSLRYLDRVAQTLGEETTDRKYLEELFLNLELWGYFRRLGYTIAAAESGYSFTELKTADTFIAAKGRWKNLRFGLFLDYTSYVFVSKIIQIIAGTVAHDDVENQRQHVLDILEETAGIGGNPEPVFVFSHIICPHPPFVFGKELPPRSFAPMHPFSDGSHFHRDDPAIREYYIRAYTSQLTALNDLVIQTVESLLDDDDPKIIVLAADHGPGAWLDWNDAGKTNHRERLSTLYAVYFDNGRYEQFYPSISHVNTFRIIFNTYFNGELKLLPDSSFYSTYWHPLKFSNVTNQLNAE